MKNEWLIQVVETFNTEPEAREAFAALTEQDGYQGGRILAPTPEKPGWRVQCFFDDEPDAAGDGWLPDGMRRVLVLASLRKQLGLTIDEPVRLVGGWNATCSKCSRAFSSSAAFHTHVAQGCR